MIKLKNNIVNEKLQLIGFRVEGTERDFGGMSKTITERDFLLQKLIQDNFNNSQIAIKPGIVEEKGSFRLSDLPMIMYVQSKGGQMVNIDPSLKLMSRVVQNNAVVGFDVFLGYSGTVVPMTYANIISISRWFKPVNFSVRNTKNKRAIVGNPSIETLPVRDITVNTPVVKAPLSAAAPVEGDRKKSGAVLKEQVASATVIPTVDLIGIVDILRDSNGVLIMLPDEKYRAVTTPDNKGTGGFVSANAGEIAYPHLAFNSTQLNASVKFRKVGSVQVMGVGKVPTYLIRQKNIFHNGENHIGKFGVAVPVGNTDMIRRTVNQSLALSEIPSDEWFTRELSTYLDAGEYVFFSIDNQKIALMTADRAAASVLDPEMLYTMIKDTYINRLAMKYLSASTGLLKELKAYIPEENRARMEKQTVWEPYQGYKKGVLESLSKAGINPYSGLYIPAPTTVTPSDKASPAEEKPAAVVDDSGISIQYFVQGCDPAKLTYSKIRDYEAQKDGVVPDKIKDLVNKFRGYKSDSTRYQKGLELLDKLDAIISAVDRQIWMHKCAMAVQGSQAVIHQHDHDDWMLNTKSRKKAMEYTNINPKFDGLGIAVSGIKMAGK